MQKRDPNGFPRCTRSARTGLVTRAFVYGATVDHFTPVNDLQKRVSKTLSGLIINGV